jgi:penicillin-binding protein 2
LAFGVEGEALPLKHLRFTVVLLTLACSSSLLQAITPVKKKRISHPKSAVTKTVAMSLTTTHTSTVARTRPKKILGGPWRVPNYADSTDGDFIDGEDLVVRRAAVDALGPMNGTVVVTDPSTGRILTIVNQKLAFQGGYQPCSTIKVPVALAALSESIVERTTLIRVYGRTTFDLTTALAKSNNQYFASLGEKLGFDRVSYYARLFGLGEKAGLEIEGEHAGSLPAVVPKSGVGMMTSFGDGISLTPLEYVALMGAVANGGTLYYLQYPKSQQDAQGMIPRVKRRLDIDQWIPEIKPGMMGAVEYGTARRIGLVDPNEPIYGKTGTCTDSRSPTHLGWFGSFAESAKGKLAVVVLLTGGKLVSGPTASGVAGQFYKNLGVQNYFAQTTGTSPISLTTN